MKRSLVLFGLIVCFAMGLSAQSILGKWRAQHNEEEKSVLMTLEMTFKADKTMLMDIILNMSDPEAMEMVFHVSLDGTYGEKNGNTLPFKLNSDNASVIVDKMEFKGEMAEQMKDNKELEAGFKKLIQDQINASKGEMINEIPTEGEMTISELTATTMKVQMDDKTDEILEFVKVD